MKAISELDRAELEIELAQARQHIEDLKKQAETWYEEMSRCAREDNARHEQQLAEARAHLFEFHHCNL